MKKLLLIFVLFINYTALAGTCTVHVTYHLKTGATDSKKHLLKASTPKECKQKTKLYKLNTTSQVVKSKDVTSKWSKK